MTSISNPEKSFWHFGLETFCYVVGTMGFYYLYHNVNVLLILQQTEIWIKVKLVVPGVGFGQDHLVLPQCLEENLLPLCPLFCQQFPLKDDTTGSHPSERAKIKWTQRKRQKHTTGILYRSHCVGGIFLRWFGIKIVLMKVGKTQYASLQNIGKKKNWDRLIPHRLMNKQTMQMRIDSFSWISDSGQRRYKTNKHICIHRFGKTKKRLADSKAFHFI